MERLCRLLTALGQDIRIVVQPSRGRGHTPLGRKLWIRRVLVRAQEGQPRTAGFTPAVLRLPLGRRLRCEARRGNSKRDAMINRDALLVFSPESPARMIDWHPTAGDS